MRGHARLLSAVFIGFGVGAITGANLSWFALWGGFVAVIAGIALAFAGTEPAVPSATAPDQQQPLRPRLKDLGSRVEQILRLAEEQANDCRDDAKREAERILAEARAEARAILDGTRATTEVPEREAPSEPQRPT